MVVVVVAVDLGCRWRRRQSVHGHAPPRRTRRRHVLVARRRRLHRGRGARVAAGAGRRRLAPQPDVAQRLSGRHALGRLPDEAALHEVHERRLVAGRLERGGERARGRRAAVLAAPRPPAHQLLAPAAAAAVRTLGQRAVARDSARADEVARALARRQESRRRHAAQLHDARQLVRLVLAREQRAAGRQLGEDAAERPHVDREPVARAEHHLGRAVEARLDVGVDALVLVAARPEVDHLHATAPTTGPRYRISYHLS